MAGDYGNIKSDKITQSKDGTPEAIQCRKTCRICDKCIEIALKDRAVNISHYVDVGGCKHRNQRQDPSVGPVVVSSRLEPLYHAKDQICATRSNSIKNCSVISGV